MDIKRDNIHEAYEKDYNILTVLKHFIFSTTFPLKDYRELRSG